MKTSIICVSQPSGFDPNMNMNFVTADNFKSYIATKLGHYQHQLQLVAPPDTGDGVNKPL